MKKSIEEIQKEIDSMDYWDMLPFDFYTKFLGDEAYILIENNKKTSWKLSLIGNEIVSYKYGDGLGWRKHDMINGIDVTSPYRDAGDRVRDISDGGLIGYSIQNIKVSESEEVKDCYRVDFDFALLVGYIVCREVLVEEIPNDFLKDIFWMKKSNASRYIEQ